MLHNAISTQKDTSDDTTNLSNMMAMSALNSKHAQIKAGLIAL